MIMDEASELWYERKSDNFADRRPSMKHSQSPREQAGDTAAASTAPVWKEVPCSPANLAAQPMVTDWIPLVSMPDRLDLVGFSATSHGAGTSGGYLIEQIQRRLHFGNENMSEIVNSFSLAEELQVAADVPGIIGKDPKRKMIQELGASDFQSKIHKTQAAEAEPKNEGSPESVKSRKEKDAKKSKDEKNSGASSHKLHSKQAKDSAASADAPTEDYIHVRAQRGQATNSHSRAERLRREKISERMRFLQDLVPGCSKITGKAVMLDEIINYVQSLQRQVEFLSMKLATVSSELNHDIDEILLKNTFLSQTGGSSFLRCGPGSSTPYHQFQQPSRQGSTPLEVDHNLYQISPAVQIPNVWDEDIQDVMHISFLPSMRPDPSIRLPGYMKTEQ